jgi:purine-nucleoside phosphorylase
LWVDPITTITTNVLYEVTFEGKPVSVVRSGIGAPWTGDTVLALGCTACERILFAGSVGGLRPDIHIGDLMLPEFSYSGDGFCRYLGPGSPGRDCFLEHSTPDEALSLALARTVSPLAQAAGVTVHRGPVFSINTILAQFGKLDFILNELGCIGIEMETAAVFKAARTVGIQAAALFSVSDVPVRHETIYAGRSQAVQNYRKDIRRQVLARALLRCSGSFHSPT